MNLSEWLGLASASGFSAPALSADQREFHQEEYRQLRQEIISLLGRVENLFRYSLIVSASVYAWLAATAFGLAGTGAGTTCLKLPREMLSWGWWIPPAFVILAALLAASSYWRVFATGTYVRCLERVLGDKALGWESFNRKTKPLMTGSAVLAWSLLLAATIGATTVGARVTSHAQIVCAQK